MAIIYRIYSNGGSGGPIDVATPIATTTGTTYTPPALAPSGDYRFAVRAHDTETGIEEANTQATVRLTLDGSGRAVGRGPNPVHALVARPLAGGDCRVEWAYHPAGQSMPPGTFAVYLTVGPTPALASPVAIVPHRAGTHGYSCPLRGLDDSTVYSVSVVARGVDDLATSLPVSTTVRGDSTPPDDVEGLTATPIR